MTKKEKLIWRLKEQPSSESLRGLVKDGLLSKEEAREILLSSELVEDRDENSLKAEIKFLRDLVDKLTNKLSNGRNTITEIIREIERPYVKWQWYKPYEIWCTGSPVYSSAGTMYALNSITTDSSGTFTVTTSNKFSDISTF